MTSATAPRGAARERTALAWRRTALAFAVNALLLLRVTDTRIQVAALMVLALATGISAASAMNFRDANMHGWFAGPKRRAAFLLAVAAAVGLIDLAALTR